MSNHSRRYSGELSSALLAGASLLEPTLPRATPPNGCDATRNSAFILQLLRQKARELRNKKPQTFYSIRTVANHFDMPATTISRIYAQLKSEGLLTTVWGSKTFVTPAKIDNQLRVRAVVALPAALTSFCTLRQYRNFFLEMRDALWNFGFATRLLFYKSDDEQLPSFSEFLLKYRPDIVIWFLPNPRLKGTVARLLDRGIRVVTVTDCPWDCCAHHYCIDRGHAIKDALLGWQRNGIHFVTVVQNSSCKSSDTTKMLERCLRDTAMPYGFAYPESLHSEDAPAARAEQVIRGVVFASSEVAVPLITRDPARFAKISRQSPILLPDGLINVPGLCASLESCDVVEVDSEPIRKRIVSDLVQSIRRRKTEPVIFRAKWIPAAAVFRLK